MKRRDFLKSSAALVGAALVGSKTLGRAIPAAGDIMNTGMPKRTLGKTGEKLSIIGLGGLVVTDAEPAAARKIVADAVAAGVNYFDVAPTYGDAEVKLGPALQPFRKNCFLACKTERRDKKGAKEHLDASLKRLQTDYLDLYQLHAITGVEKDVKAAFAKDGAMQTFLEAKKAGVVKYLGFSTHSEAAALAAMELYDFDTVLCPTNFCCHFDKGFENNILAAARKKKMGILCIKAMAKQRWPNKQDKKQFPKCWYQPIEDPDLARQALDWTLSQPGVTAALPPGDQRLFEMALSLVPRLGKISPADKDHLRQIAKGLHPIFPL